MARKLTDDEIRVAGELVDKIYREQGDPYGQDAARELKARMVMCGNTDDDSKWYFNKYARYNWDSI